jgi:hypothetical protein
VWRAKLLLGMKFQMSINIPDLTDSNLDWLASSGWLAKSPSQAPASCIRDVVALTQRLFGGPCKVTVEMDPEIEGLKSLVFEATTSLGVEELVARRRQWHREVRQLVRDPHNFRLIFDVQ